MDKNQLTINLIHIKNMVNSHIQQASPSLGNVEIPKDELKEVQDLLENLDGHVELLYIEKKLMEGHPNVAKLLDKYVSKIMDELAGFEIKSFQGLNVETPWGDKICEVLEEMKSCRDQLLELIFVLYENQEDAHRYVAQILTKLLQFNYIRFEYFDQQNTSGYWSGDNYRIFNYEVFLYTCSFLIERGFLSDLALLLDEIFQVACIREKYYAQPSKEYRTLNFLKFNIPPISIDDQKRRIQHGKIYDWEFDGSLLTELLEKRYPENLPFSFNTVVETDVLLFYISLFRNDGFGPDGWTPYLASLQPRGIDLMLRASSKRFFEENIKALFHVKNCTEFVKEVEQKFKSYAYEKNNIHWLKIRKVPYPEILNLTNLCTQS